MRNQEIVELIVKEVMKRLAKPRGKALAVFTGGTAGFDQGVEQISKMKADGWEIKVLITNGAETIPRSHPFEEILSGFEVCFESRLDHSVNLLDNVNCILIPVLTMNSAVKLALGIVDTPATHLLSNALLGGIPVIAAKEACNPRANMAVMPAKEAEAYAAMLEKHLKSLEEFGVRLVPCTELSASAVRLTKGNPGSSSGTKKRILTKEDIIQAKKNGISRIVLEENMKVTPYAAEAAGEVGVEIICLSQA